MSSRSETLLSWLVNAVIVLILPLKLGFTDSSMVIFLAYSAICGTILTVAEDRRFLKGVFVRADVRGYLLARIAIVAVLGIVPFLLARASA